MEFCNIYMKIANHLIAINFMQKTKTRGMSMARFMEYMDNGDFENYNSNYGGTKK
jgi:hypothetical protein